jgi:hypothetical protein
MERNDFYNDLKWCDDCEGYVRYLKSMEHSYCIDCGCKVRLFNESDWAAFNEKMRAGKPKGGRPSKKREAEAS